MGQNGIASDRWTPSSVGLKKSLARVTLTICLTVPDISTMEVRERESQGYLTRSHYGASYTDTPTQRFMKLQEVKQLRQDYPAPQFRKVSLNKSWATGLTMWDKLDRRMKVDTKKRWYIPRKSKGLDLFPWK